VEEKLFFEYEIRDTKTHTSDIFNVGEYSVYTVYITNRLDQAITIQVKANRTKETAGAVDVGSSFSVASNTEESRTFAAEDVFLPFVFITAVCSVAPISGSLSAYLLKK